MRILIITQKVDIEDQNLGFFHRWIEEFAKKSAKVTVIAGAVGKYSFPANVSVYSLGKEKGTKKAIRIYIFLRLFIWHYIKSADAVFFHMIPEYVVLAYPFIYFSKKSKALWYVHKSVTFWLGLAERAVDFIFTASDLSFRLPSKKVIYTGHAIDTNFFKAMDHEKKEGGLRIMTSGRISPVKDYETMIRACASLKNSWPHPWTLSIVGGPSMPRDHEYMSTLKKLVRDLGLEQYIVFLGARPYAEMPSIYNDHDIFISMSTTGSIDKAVLEAMSSGLSVLCANEAFAGILSSPYFIEKRNPELLAQRIKSLANESRPNLKLRTIVEEEHGLEKTIEKIMSHLSSYN